MDSIWSIDGPRYPALEQDADVDVAIIGGGITGLTAALRLTEAGKSVVVLEAREVGGGSTGGSTGNLYSPVAKGLAAVRDKWDDDTAAAVVDSRAQAVDLIEMTIQQFGIECGFHRRPLYRILPQPDSERARALDEEADALTRAGLAVASADDAATEFNVRRGLKIEDQAQFQPLAYAQGLAAVVTSQGGAVHEGSRVLEADYDEGVLRTERAEVRAGAIVSATHTPAGINVLQTGMVPSREYAVSARLRTGAYPEGIFWLLDPFHSIRSYRHDGDDYLMVIGEKHKTGETGDAATHYQRLREYLERNFDIDRFEYHWSAQQYSSADELPYIGRLPGGDKAYVATGFSGDGLVWGTLGGMIIGDRILGHDNPWAERFDSERFTPMKSAREWMKENVSVTKHLARDYLSPDNFKELESVPSGEGRVVTLEGEQLAVHRDPEGGLSVVSATCPHMKCVVHWNPEDSTWDCPCHGSRFEIDGTVLEGPTLHPLSQRVEKG